MTTTDQIQSIARELLASGQVSTVIGYEVGPRGRTRPVFVTSEADTSRLVWNQCCTHNLTTYLRHKLHSASHAKREEEGPNRVAVVVKPCDSRAVNVLLAEKQFTRDQVYLIGVACEGVHEGAGFGKATGDSLQSRCKSCIERIPVVFDILAGEPPEVEDVEDPFAVLERVESLSPAERMEFWLSQFDRCIRCYACRQVCPMCNCPTCLYDRDDSLWVGMGTGMSEKRAFHLGRAYHLAGRCVGCGECSRVCPVNIPLGLLNRMMTREIRDAFGYRAGIAPVPSPITTVLSGEES